MQIESNADNIKRDPSIDVEKMFANNNDNQEAPSLSENTVPNGIIIPKQKIKTDAEIVAGVADEASSKFEDITNKISSGEDPFNDEVDKTSFNATLNTLKDQNNGFDQNMSSKTLIKAEGIADGLMMTPTGVYPKNHPKAIAYMKQLEYIKNNQNTLLDTDSTTDEEVSSNENDTDEIGEKIENTENSNDNKENDYYNDSFTYNNHKTIDNSKNTEKGGEIMEFNVPAENASDFISSMPIEDRDKMERSKVVKVNEIHTVDVPVATRRIRDISEYKRVAHKKYQPETIDAVMINSGYLATFKGCGSLKLLSLTPDDSSGTIDWSKRYSICYDQLVDTSIGKLSYQEFVSRTASTDVDEALRAILRAGCVDNDKVMLRCGSCGSEYEIDYSLNALIDLDTMEDETKSQMTKIMESRMDVEDARKVHEESPVMTSKIVKLSDQLTISMKTTDGTSAISVYPKFKAITDRYNPLISAFLMFVNKVWLTDISEDPKTGEEVKDVYLINDVDTIAEILFELSDTELEILRQEATTVHSIPKFTYSFKGPYTCPNCGKTEEKVACTIDSLVFHRVQKHIV